MLGTGAFVAVLDGEAMRLFRNKSHEPGLDLVELAAPEMAIANAGSGGRHRSSTANPNTTRLLEDNFVAAAANHLNALALAREFEQIVIVADPRTLGELRKHFHKSLEAKLIGQVAEDLVMQPVQAIKAHIRAA